MRTRINNSQAPISSITHTDLDHASLSLHALTTLPLSPCARKYLSILQRVVSTAYTSPIETYITFVQLYNTPSRWTHDEFQAFIDPQNISAQILLAHFIAIQAILTPVLYMERHGFQGVDAPTCVLSWIEGIYKGVPGHLRGLVEWPRRVSAYPWNRFLGQKGTPDDEVEVGLSMYFPEEGFRGCAADTADF
jgi:hypothetical protein